MRHCFKSIKLLGYFKIIRFEHCKPSDCSNRIILISSEFNLYIFITEIHNTQLLFGCLNKPQKSWGCETMRLNHARLEGIHSHPDISDKKHWGPIHTGRDARSNWTNGARFHLCAWCCFACCLACSVYRTVAATGFACPNLLRFSCRVQCGWSLKYISQQSLNKRVNLDWICRQKKPLPEGKTLGVVSFEEWKNVWIVFLRSVWRRLNFSHWEESWVFYHLLFFCPQVSFLRSLFWEVLFSTETKRTMFLGDISFQWNWSYFLYKLLLTKPLHPKRSSAKAFKSALTWA